MHSKHQRKPGPGYLLHCGFGVTIQAVNPFHRAGWCICTRLDFHIAVRGTFLICDPFQKAFESRKRELDDVLASLRDEYGNTRDNRRRYRRGTGSRLAPGWCAVVSNGFLVALSWLVG